MRTDGKEGEYSGADNSEQDLNIDSDSEDILENDQILQGLVENNTDNAQTNTQSLDKELAEAMRSHDNLSDANTDLENNSSSEHNTALEATPVAKNGSGSEIKQRTASKSETRLSSTFARLFGKVTV